MYLGKFVELLYLLPERGEYLPPDWIAIPADEADQALAAEATLQDEAPQATSAGREDQR